MWGHTATGNRPTFKISNYSDSYLIIIDTKVHYDKWDNLNMVIPNFYGFEPEDYNDQITTGNLRGRNVVYDPTNPNDFARTMYIVPKSAIKSKNSSSFYFGLSYYSYIGKEDLRLRLFEADLIQ